MTPLRSALLLTAALLALPSLPARADDGYGGARIDAEPDAGHAPVLTKAPALVQSVEPTYPEQAKAEKLTGDVTMQVDIGADGKVAEVTVLQGSGHGFDEAATEAVRKFLFSPAEIDNVPAPVRIQYTQHFVYTEPPPVVVEVPDGGPPPPPLLPVTLRGKILERGSRKLIGGAAVKVTQLGKETCEPAVTEIDGTFELRIPPGDATLEVVDVNHLLYTTHETIKAGEQLEVAYYVMPKSYGLYETVVRADREKKEVTRHTLQREELEKVPGSFGDPIRVIHDLPGLARPPFGLGLLIVRGSSPNDTGTYIDGVQLPLLFHFGAGPSVINPEFLDRIDFFPGGFGSEYGRAIGGIVDVHTRSPKEGEIHGSAKADFIDSGIFVSAPITEGLTVSAAGRRSYADVLLRAILPHVSSSGILVAPSYYDYQARLDYKPPTHPGNTFTLFFMGSDDLLTVATGGDNSFEVNDHQGFKRLVGTWQYRHNNLTITSEPYLGADQNSIGVGTLQIDTPSKVGGLREKLEVALDPYFTFRAGIDSQIDLASYSIRVPGFVNDYRRFPGERVDPPPVTITGEGDLYEYGEWIEAEFGSNFGLKILPSLRFDEFKVGREWKPEFDPRLVARQELGPEHRTALKASVGLYSELPPAMSLSALGGNPDLPAQHAFQTSAGVEQKITEAINIDVTGFYNRRYDLAERSGVVLIEPDGSLRRVNQLPTGKGRSYGVEVLLRHEITKHFFGWLAYTLSKSEDDANPGLGFTASQFDQRHILTAIAQYKFGNGWELGGRFQLTTGDPTTPVVGSTYQADTDGYSPINGAAGSARLPTFNQLDLRLDKTWLFDRWTLGAYLDVQNVYNAQNEEFLINDYRYRTQQVIPGIPILPTLGVKGSF